MASNWRLRNLHCSWWKSFWTLGGRLWQDLEHQMCDYQRSSLRDQIWAMLWTEWVIPSAHVCFSKPWACNTVNHRNLAVMLWAYAGICAISDINPKLRLLSRCTYWRSHVWIVHDMCVQVGDFGDDNRAGIDGTLHRISCIRNRDREIVGLTCRVGRAVQGCACLAADYVQAGKSVLILGKPGMHHSQVWTFPLMLLALVQLQHQGSLNILLLLWKSCLNRNCVNQSSLRLLRCFRANHFRGPEDVCMVWFPYQIESDLCFSPLCCVRRQGHECRDVFACWCRCRKDNCHSWAFSVFSRGGAEAGSDSRYVQWDWRGWRHPSYCCRTSQKIAGCKDRWTASSHDRSRRGQSLSQRPCSCAECKSYSQDLCTLRPNLRGIKTYKLRAQQWQRRPCCLHKAKRLQGLAVV